MLEEAGCDLVFAPSAEEMYPGLPEISINFGQLETVMEGHFRPGHFNGVGIVVAKLFHIIQPARAYFGLKDLQQVAVIRTLVKDLNFDLEIIPCPTLREPDGLAMSSRNTRLSAEARRLAPAIYKALEDAREGLTAGQPSALAKAGLLEYFSKMPEFDVEYVEIADFDTLKPVNEKQESGKTAICIAAYLDGVRLIDNLVF